MRKKSVIFLLLLIIMVCVGAAGWKLGFISWESTVSDEGSCGFAILTDAFTDQKIVDQKSAFDAVNAAAQILGIRDVEAEFSQCLESTAMDYTFYRFYQKYEEIPVYGRSVVIGADYQGDSIGLVSNYQNLDGIDLTQSVDAGEAKRITMDLYETVNFVINEGLVIYSLFGIDPMLAWKIRINGDGTEETCFVSAGTGAMLGRNALIHNADMVGGKSVYINEGKSSDTGYELNDTERNIRVYDAKGTQILVMAVDEEGRMYNSYENEEEKPISDGAKIARYVVVQSREDGYTELDIGRRETDGWDNQEAVNLYSRVASTYDFYEEVLQRRGFDGNNGNMIVVYHDDSYAGEGNAYSHSWKYEQEVNSIICIDKECEFPLEYSTLGHEYTHSVIYTTAEMVYKGEAGALNEAYADIFGEIVEDWGEDASLSDSCDWRKDEVNLKNPAERLESKRNKIDLKCYYESKGETCPVKKKHKECKTNNGKTYKVTKKSCLVRIDYPSYYKEEGNWIDPQSTFDWGGVHINSKVISYAAYLMWNGIDGSDEYSRLNSRELAEVFYLSLFSLPADCTFAEFRSIIQNTATIMNKKERLHEKQVHCIDRAFEIVGIPMAEGVTYEIKEHAELMVYGLSGMPCSNYGIGVNEVRKKMNHDVGIRQFISAGTELEVEVVTQSGPYKLDLQKGKNYQIILADTGDEMLTYQFYVKVSDEGESSLDIYTNFSERKNTESGQDENADSNEAYERYQEAVQASIASGKWSELLSMEMAMKIEADGERTKYSVYVEADMDILDYQAGNPGALKLSGTTGLRYLSEEISYHVDYSDGVAHFEYLKPDNRTVDVEMDPAFFDFNQISREMMMDASVTNHKISFTIAGEDVKKIGIPVDSVMQGDGDMNFGDAYVELEVDGNSGKIMNVHIICQGSMAYQGYRCEADCEIKYEIQYP